MRGEKGRGQRLEARRDVGRAGERILSIFRDEKEDGTTKILPPEPSTPREGTYRKVLTRIIEIEELARSASQEIEAEHKKGIVESLLLIRYAFQVSYAFRIFGDEHDEDRNWETAIETCLNSPEWPRDEARLDRASAKRLHETLREEAVKILPAEYQTS